MFDADKKRKEREILNLFKQLCKDFPKGKISSSESPDFLLQISRRKKIGIEITCLNEFFSADNLSALIAKKEEKICFYRKILPYELWLIISCSNITQPQLDVYFRNQVKSGFDKIYLVDENKNILIQLAGS